MRLVSASVASSTAGSWSADALLAGLVGFFFVLGCEHSGEEAWTAAVGDDNNVGSCDFVMPALAFFVE